MPPQDVRALVLKVLHHGKWALADSGHVADAGTYEDAERWVEVGLERSQYLELSRDFRRRIALTAEVHSVVTNRSRTLLVWLLELMAAE